VGGRCAGFCQFPFPTDVALEVVDDQWVCMDRAEVVEVARYFLDGGGVGSCEGDPDKERGSWLTDCA